MVDSHLTADSWEDSPVEPSLPPPGATEAPAPPSTDEQFQITSSSLLQQYADEVGAEQTLPAGESPEPESPPTQPSGGPGYGAGTTAAPSLPYERWEQVITDPVLGPSAQSMMDKAVSAYFRANQERWVQEAVAQREAESRKQAQTQEQITAQREAREARIRALEVAGRNDPDADYEQDVLDLRKQIAQEMLQQERQQEYREQIQAEIEQELRERTRSEIGSTVEQEAIARAGQNLAAQYEAAYAQIPELRDVVDQIHHNKFSSGTDWLVAFWNAAREVASRGETARAEDLAQQRSVMALNDYRARMPAQDFGPSNGTGGNGYGGGVSGPGGRFRSVGEAEAEFNAGRASAAEVRLARAAEARGLIPYYEGGSPFG